MAMCGTRGGCLEEVRTPNMQGMRGASWEHRCMHMPFQVPKPEILNTLNQIWKTSGIRSRTSKTT